MINRNQREFIGLVFDPNETKYRRAPSDFDWQHYPEVLQIDGKTWRYFATYDAVPYYRAERGL